VTSSVLHVLTNPAIEWQVFGTLTYTPRRGGRIPGPVVCRKNWFAFLRAVQEDAGVPFSRLLWVLRSELGEITGRPHFHFLLSGIPSEKLNPSFLHVMDHRWEEADCRRMSPAKLDPATGELATRAHASIRRFAPGISGPEYVAKNLGCTWSGGDHYEVAKFKGLESVEFSKSVWEVLRAARRRSDTQINRATIRKARPLASVSRCSPGRSSGGWVSNRSCAVT